MIIGFFIVLFLFMFWNVLPELLRELIVILIFAKIMCKILKGFYGFLKSMGLKGAIYTIFVIILFLAFALAMINLPYIIGRNFL